MLTQSYATACKFLHTRSVALLMLQIAVGKCIVSEKQVAELRGELSEKIRGCQDPDEKAYLIQIQSMINRQFENDLPKPSYNAQGVIQREAKEGITIDDLISVMESILDTYKSKPFAREQTAASAAAAVSGDQTASQPSTPRQRAKTIQ